MGNEAADSVIVPGILRVNNRFLPPQYTTAQRDAITNPSVGSVIYNTTTNAINYYNGIRWIELREASTGTIVYSETPVNPSLTAAGYVCIGRTEQAIADVTGTSVESWAATSATGAPFARTRHTAVWTGSEMIIWGGWDGAPYNYLNTGGRYNPATDSWTATNTNNAPQGRWYHTAVWTGSEMIIWGGFKSLFLNTGGRYNPTTDTWISTSTTNAPSERAGHAAVWTGSEMIVWGGRNPNSLNTGGRYNPASDTWVINK
ncbi:MAG: Kelch repeat-containing protein [Bacteroidales bacterium]